MFFKKCSVPDCDITSSSLLTTITTQNLKLHVCPKHIRAFGMKLKKNENLDYRILNEYQNIAKTCELCTKPATYYIESRKSQYNGTHLCHSHLIESFTDRLNDHQHQALKRSYSEIALHRSHRAVLT